MGFTDLQDGHGLIGISVIPTDCFFWCSRFVMKFRTTDLGPGVTKCGSEPVLQTTKSPH